MYKPLLSLIAGGALLFHAAVPGAQEYPNKPLRFIVPNAPGNNADLVARVLAPEMSKILGQTVVVENKPGAGQVIGFEYVAKQMPADSYTLLSGSVSSLAILPVTAKDLRFDPLRDLPPVMGLVESRSYLVSPAMHPWKTFREFVAYAKASPGKLNYADPAPIVRFVTAAVLREVGLELVGVPYSSIASYMPALLSGEVHLGILGDGQVLGAGNKIRVLAITGEQRNATFPDVPTFAELGLNQVRGLGYSLNVRSGTPKAVTDRLYAATSKALQTPDAITQFAKVRLEISTDNQETAAKRLLDEGQLYANIARQINFKPE